MDLGTSKYAVRLGATENDFDERDYEFLQAKLKSWPKLPVDFRQGLSRYGFREKLQRHLRRAARREMSLPLRIENMRNEEEINSIWNLALREAVLTRMERLFPGYAKVKEDFMPLELRYEAQRQRRMLSAKVSAAIWSDHQNWRRVEREFARVKTVYKQVVNEQLGISAELKKDWLARIESVRLVIPGSDPELEMEGCSRTESNAYYFREKNYITVCAGDFNAEEIEQTLAHEISHALDIGRSRHLAKMQSSLGEGLLTLKEMSCSKKAFDCGRWQAFRDSFSENLKPLESFVPQLKSFNQCLQEKPVRSEIPDEYASRIAKEEVDGILGDLARRDVFLRIISPEMPMPDGSRHRNPMHLNPCGYYLWDTQVQPLDQDVSLLLFFTAEYRCSALPDRAEKFRTSIEAAKQMQTQFTRSSLRMDAEFSSRYRLERDGYSSSPTERFADNLGQVVFAHLLKQEADVRQRRARYLANNAWLCRRPSIQQLFPGEAKIQRSYYVESHSETGQRQKELLSEDIREALDCKQDFTVRQCRL